MTVTKKGNPTVESEKNCREERSSEITLRSRAAELSRQMGQGISRANLTTLLLVVSQVTRIWRFSGRQWWHDAIVRHARSSPR